MNDISITVGGNFEEEASKAVIDAWHRAERGEQFCERHYAFENWETLARVLTNRRIELLSYVRRNKVKSIRSLSIALKRDYSNVHADVRSLVAAGLLENKDGLHTKFERIDASIAL